MRKGSGSMANAIEAVYSVDHSCVTTAVDNCLGIVGIGGLTLIIARGQVGCYCCCLHGVVHLKVFSRHHHSTRAAEWIKGKTYLHCAK